MDKLTPEGKDLGFLHSAPFLKVWVGDKTSTIRLGKEVVAQESFYGMIEGEKTVLEVSSNIMTKFFNIFDGAAQEAPKVEPEIAVSPSPSPSPETTPAPAAASPVSLAAASPSPSPAASAKP